MEKITLTQKMIKKMQRFAKNSKSPMTVIFRLKETEWEKIMTAGFADKDIHGYHLTKEGLSFLRVLKKI